MVLVFGNIGQMREIRKRTDHRIGLVTREFLEQFVEFGTRSGITLGIGMATQTDRSLTNCFDHFKDCFTFLVA